LNEEGRLLMTDQSTSYRATRLLIVAATFVIIIWGINQAQSVLVLCLISAFLAIVGRVPVVWLERKRIPSIAAVLIVVAAMVTLLLGLAVVVGASLNDFSNALPLYQARMDDMLLGLKALLATKGIMITDKVLLDYINPGMVMDLTAGLFALLSSVLSNIVLILFTVTFVLLEAPSLSAKLRVLYDDPKASFPQFTRFANDIKRYIVIKTLINAIAGILIATWLSFLGVNFPVLWGFLAFLLTFIPSIGSVVAAVPVVLLALIQLGSGSAALVAAGYVAIGSIVGNFLEPRVMGRQFRMSTLVVFLSLIFWGNLLGLVGALLCVPLTMALKLVCEVNEDTRWLAVLLGPETSPKQVPAKSEK